MLSSRAVDLQVNNARKCFKNPIQLQNLRERLFSETLAFQSNHLDLCQTDKHSEFQTLLMHQLSSIVLEELNSTYRSSGRENNCTSNACFPRPSSSHSSISSISSPSPSLASPTYPFPQTIPVQQQLHSSPYSFEVTQPHQQFNPPYFLFRPIQQSYHPLLHPTPPPPLSPNTHYHAPPCHHTPPWAITRHHTPPHLSLIHI